eukprot:1378640-Amorphochlora_amoeboformis.AAC.2
MSDMDHMAPCWPARGAGKGYPCSPGQELIPAVGGTHPALNAMRQGTDTNDCSAENQPRSLARPLHQDIHQPQSSASRIIDNSECHIMAFSLSYAM